MTIAERMFGIIKNRSLKSSDLALHLGVSKSVVSSWKTRNTNPPSEFIVQICEFLNISIAYFLTGIETTEKSPQTDLTESEREILKLVQPLSDKDKIKVIGIIENYLTNR
ncbi:MAG: helix-turn-helix domain-containing protein [Hydrogenoanaerobacterium sp.]